MNRKKLHSLFGLKWNPFTPDVPVEGLWASPRIESFCNRVENIVHEGGFVLVTGEPGSGKSVVLRILAEKLSDVPELSLGLVTRPQSRLTDFYRELGELFSVDLRPLNRWGGFKGLRERWKGHAESSLLRPVLMIDEAQEMDSVVLSELRILSFGHLDTETYLTIILSGDARLTDRFRQPDLLPLGSRIRTRLVMDRVPQDELSEALQTVLKRAGCPQLITPPVQKTLVDHATGNFRVLMSLAGELLIAACEREQTNIDEKLFFELHGERTPRKRGGRRAAT